MQHIQILVGKTLPQTSVEKGYPCPEQVIKKLGRGNSINQVLDLFGWGTEIELW